MSCKHTAIELKAGKAATCTENGVEEYYECADCHKLFSDEAGKNVITAPVVIKALGHTYTAADPFTCARNCGYENSKNMVSGESLTLLNQYKGDFNLTFKVVKSLFIKG